MASLFPATQRFVDAKGHDYGLERLNDKKRIGIYFSAHWCPPCRGFTPVLAQAYTTIRQSHPDFEVVFVSSDKDDAAFREYLGEMPWIALPRTDPTAQRLKQSFGVQGIPMFVVVDQDGNLVTKDGRGIVQGDAPNKFARVWERLNG
eukprot:TRINITY_DN7994_c0_g1_i1.p2 TRINITY_DN7994_c0_g1~~TRINITY_DN7994_c0_g1_i1.p2  ORF type:complete len:147 (+),score=34.84 TRINITY_DN7994_c0_g1_i1:46-486(+)